MLINDNVPKLLNIDESNLRKCADEKEFFMLLNRKIFDNLQKLYDTKDINKKLNCLCDIESDINVIKNELMKYVDNLDEAFDARSKKIGGYINRYVYELRGEQIPKPITKEDIEFVEQFGKDNNYPPLVLKRIDGKITKTLGAGKECWDNAIAWADLRDPYNDNFRAVMKAIETKDFM